MKNNCYIIVVLVLCVFFFGVLVVMFVLLLGYQDYIQVGIVKVFDVEVGLNIVFGVFIIGKFMNDVFNVYMLVVGEWF